MNQHPYLKAYMAGIAAPTMFLLVIMVAFIILRHVYQVPIPIERIIVFPMALVPNIFGAWNALYVWINLHQRFPLGIHGALLPFVLAPIGLTIATALGFLALTPSGLVYFQAVTVSYGVVAVVFPMVIVVYYLVWKYVVGFFNKLQGIA